MVTVLEYPVPGEELIQEFKHVKWQWFWMATGIQYTMDKRIEKVMTSLHTIILLPEVKKMAFLQQICNPFLKILILKNRKSLTIRSTTIGMNMATPLLPRKVYVLTFYLELFIKDDDSHYLSAPVTGLSACR